ncbi:MAG: sulfur carrier protein ThiS [Chthoniobacteraceae bacterium]
MKIQLNGAAHDTAAKNIAELIAELGLPGKAILVEHNLRALHPREWAETPLSDGNSIEILKVVAGG